MKVFCDFHHDALYYSLQLLFEKRLGWELFRPIGEEWFKEGYWKIAAPYNDNPGTIIQYLGIRDEVYQPSNGTRPLNEIAEESKRYYLIKAPYKNHKAVTLEQFKNIKFDFILASYLPHYHTFTELRNKYQPQAKVICQAGNNWLLAANWNEVKNLMAACVPVPIPSGVNAIFYHEEFDTNIYKPIVRPSNAIRSFVNTLGQADLFKEDWRAFLGLEKALPEFEFRSHGSSCRDGVIGGDEKIAKLMQESIFGFHLKNGGDGMGMVIHQWFACGRPPIVRTSQYKGQLASKLMIDGETCIDLDKRTFEGNVKRIRQIAQGEEYDKICQKVYNKFKTIVDWEKEFEEIKKFLERLI